MNSKTINPHENYRRYRYYRFSSSVGSWSRCTYPSIHFFVSRSRSVVDCAHIRAFTFLLTKTLSRSRSVVDCVVSVCVYTWCGGVCVCTCGVVCTCCVVCCVVVLWCCVWCVVVWYVARLGARKKSTPVFMSSSPPCVHSKCLRVYWQDARMLNTSGRFAGAHEGILKLHTEACGT